MKELRVAEEKRSDPRCAASQPVNLELTSMEQGKVQSVQIEGTCIDISSGGMGMSTDARLKTGDVLKLHLTLNDMNVRLPILSEVKWLQQIDAQYKVGLQFLA